MESEVNPPVRDKVELGVVPPSVFCRVKCIGLIVEVLTTSEKLNERIPESTSRTKLINLGAVVSGTKELTGINPEALKMFPATSWMASSSTKM